MRAKQLMRMTGSILTVAAGLMLSCGTAIAKDDERRASSETPLGATMSGKTELENDAGRIEARLLTGVVVKEAARQIVSATGTDYSTLTMVVLPVPREADNASAIVGGMGWDVLQGADRIPVVTDLVRVRDGLEGFRLRYAAIAEAGTRACRATIQAEKAEGSGEKGFLQQIDEITAGLQLATPLLNLFKQDFVYHGLRMQVREGMLVTAVRGEIAARRKPAAPSSGGGAQSLADAMATVERQIAALPASAQCGDSDGGAETARAALAEDFSRFSSELSGPGSDPATTLLAAAEDQLQRFGPRPATLVLAIDGDGASLIERRNIATLFGGESTTVSSGILISYEFYEPQSGGVASLRAAGVLSCVSGAVGLRAIHHADKIHRKARCF